MGKWDDLLNKHIASGTDMPIDYARAVEELENDNAALRAEVERLTILSDQAICIFCHATMPKTLEAMVEHAKECEKRPENRLMRENERLEWMLAHFEEADPALFGHLADHYQERET